MARKKHKAGKSSVQSNPPAAAQAGGGRAWTAGEWSLPALGALALILAWLAALGGLADGGANLRDIVESDAVRPFTLFQELFVTQDFPLSGWRWGMTTYYFPEYLIQWTLFALGADLLSVLYFIPLALAVFSAGGWILVCHRLFGPSPARAAAVLLAHAAPLLIVGWGRVDVFGTLLISMYRTNTWATMPWLLWLTLRALDSGGGKPDGAFSRASLVPLAIFLAVAIVSDFIVFTWFVAPALAAAFLLVRLGQLKPPALFRLTAAMAAGVALGMILAEFPEHYKNTAAQPVNPAQAMSAIGNFAAFMSDLTAANAAETMAWAAFVFIGLRRLAVALRLRRENDSPASRLFGVPKTRAHLFAAIFVPASAAAALAFTLLAGKFPIPWIPDLWRQTRYFLPFVFFPLFIGWALLPWNFAPALAARTKWAAAAACAALALAALPKVAAVDAEKLDYFDSPFHRCFARAANRLGWEGGVGQVLFMPTLQSNPNANVNRFVSAVALRSPQPGRSGMFVDWHAHNRNWFNGEFQFAVVNGFNGRVFERAPRERDAGCPIEDFSPCISNSAMVLDDRAVRGALGEPQEIVECAGVGFYHYDPPIRLDFTHLSDPHFAQIGRGF